MTNKFHDMSSSSQYISMITPDCANAYGVYCVVPVIRNVRLSVMLQSRLRANFVLDLDHIITGSLTRTAPTPAVFTTLQVHGARCGSYLVPFKMIQVLLFQNS